MSHRRSDNILVEKEPYYPLELVRAIVVVWLFAGLRSDEIHRLRLGCVRWNESERSEDPKKRSVCLLNVPVNKTSNEYVKPVDYVVGEVIEIWEKLRPESRSHWDSKTGDNTNFLFVWRGKLVSKKYINYTVIPMLCEKAGVPTEDARGNITSHRARSTVATQLFNAQQPLSLIELMHWLGHKSLRSTQHYVRMNPAKLSSAYKEADFFSRNMLLVDVLIDKENAKENSGGQDSTTLYYDLIHGYCTYDYFAKCPHRMACAKCTFYVPKVSEQAKLIEAKSNILRMQQFMPLSDLEILAVEEDASALSQLIDKLQDINTPEGTTPRQLKERD